MKILMSAYACEPGRGSEPGVGWNIAREIAKYHEVWVMTRPDEAGEAIEAELKRNPVPNLHFIYFTLPFWANGWKQGKAIELHYYLWQIQAYFVARRLHRQIGFNLLHHVTFGRYWVPSFLSLLPVPLIWGPVGGGESAPRSFWRDFGWRGRLAENIRDIARWLGERSFFVKLTAQRCAVALVATFETADRLKALGTKHIEFITGQTGINEKELQQLEQLPIVSTNTPIRFLSIGRLLYWKGFHLGLKAFALANIKDSEYWIVGEGGEKTKLENLAKELGIADRVHFCGNLPREKALNILGTSNALVHPSLHDFSPTVCLEAMAAARPVLCLDLGGPAIQITEETGFKIPATSPDQVVHDLATAMTTLAQNPELQIRMGEAGRKRVKDKFSWYSKGQFLIQLFQKITSANIE